MTADSAPREEFGPIELFVVEFDGTEADEGVISALVDLAHTGDVRLVDLVVVVRLADGSVRVTEMAELDAQLAASPRLVAEGLIGQEDIDDAADGLRSGTGVALAAMEMRWAIALSSTLASAGGHVAHVALIPAPVVNALVASGLAAPSTEKE